MKKNSLFVLSLLCVQNFYANAMESMEHGILFEEPDSMEGKYPYLKKVNINILPLLSNNEDIEIKENNFIAENEYAIDDSSQAKGVATTGIYDCIGLVIPSANILMHIHQQTNLESVNEVIKNHSTKNVYLYTSSIIPYIEKVVETLNQSGFTKELITLSLRPLAIEEFDFNAEELKEYAYSYDDTYKDFHKTMFMRDTMVQKVSFYVKEEEKEQIKICYLKNLHQELKFGVQKSIGFLQDVRQPINISLKEREISLFKIDSEEMRRKQEEIYKLRNSLDKSSLVLVNFK